MTKGIRPALGQVASLGDLYDARTDNFCHVSLFNKKIPESAITRTDNHFSDTHLIHSDTYSEKFSKWNVEAELRASVLSGLVTLKGSGRYLSEQKTSARTVKCSLLYNILTKEEKVNIYDENLRESIVLDGIENGMATHVIVGISWGANTVLSCEYHNKDERDVKEIKGKFGAQMKLMALSISGKASVNFDEGDHSKGINFEIRIFGDVLPTNQELPTTCEAALNLMKQMPTLVGNSNEGKGKPLTYHLYPLELLKGYLKFSIKANSMIRSLEEDSLLRIVQLFEQTSEIQQQLYDFCQDAQEHRYCVPPEDVATVLSVKEEMAIKEAKFRTILATTLTEVRSGKADVSKLEQLIMNYKTGEFSPEKVTILFSKWSHITEKIVFAKILVQNGVKYIGIETSLDNEIMKDFNNQSYVLYFKEEAKSANPEVWKQNRQIFLQEVMKDGGFKYYAVDCDIHPELWPMHGLCIQVLKSGQVITSDLLADHQKTDANPVAHSTTVMEKVTHKPNKRTRLLIPCTGNNCDPGIEYEWICEKCNQPLEYGFDDHVYCSCGRAKASLIEFKCPHRKHGVAFEKHEGQYLRDLLEKLRPFKEMNILILGETGVGKSTWINGFVNFLTYGSLQEAEQNELCSLIPSQFTVCDENLEQILVSTGTDDNEVHTQGQSATQGCKVYPFPIGNTFIRIIDTPGIGDTRGIDQDKKNFENILRTLAYLEELHGICILLKPNNARLTVMFRFCIKELLTYLHRDASRNIVFCFTNSRGTFYRPGDTLPALRQLLEDNREVEIPVAKPTVYCFDSEAYRFLAAIKNKPNPVTFPDEERANFSNSWVKSIEETKRMLQHISTLQPHRIKSTLNLNHARQLVVQLTRPLAEISKTIQVNREVLKEQLEDIQLTEANIKELEKKRMYPKKELEIVQLDYPKTVCTNTNCKTIYGPKDSMQIDYHQVCHDHCRLQGVDRDTKGHPGLIECWAMKNGYCRHSQCTHHYKEHMHIYFDSKEITKMVEDESVKDSLNQKLNANQMKQKMIENKKNEIAEYDEELNQIQEASAKFACFLKNNAITPYNDAMLEYMDHLIKEEKSKTSVGGSDKVLKSLEKTRAAYEKQIFVLDEAMRQGKGVKVLSPEEVEGLVKKLYKLKHNGKALEKALSVLNETRNNVAIYQEVPPPSVLNKKGCWERTKNWFSRHL